MFVVRWYHRTQYCAQSIVSHIAALRHFACVLPPGDGDQGLAAVELALMAVAVVVVTQVVAVANMWLQILYTEAVAAEVLTMMGQPK